MKLKEIIQRHHWLSVETTLLQCYPDQQKNIDGYRKVHEILLQLPSVDTAMQLQIYWVADEDHIEQGYHDVSGLESDEAIAYSIEFRPWAEWLGMAVTEETYAVYTELEITAHCLFGMTFAGFDEATIQSEWNEIIRASEELENMSEEERKRHLLTVDELFRELRGDD